MDRVPRVLIIGGGFGGLQAAKKLVRTPVDIVLVDRHNYHLFQPLLYQVATAALSPAEIAAPIRRILRSQSNVEVRLAEATGVDLEKRLVTLRAPGGATLEEWYDYLVLATGATHSYFGHDDWADCAPGLKTVDDALEIRRRVLTAFEAAELEEDEEERRAKLTFVVVGGGPTGVELAGALREIAANSIPADFRRVDTKTARIVVVEGQDRLLPAMSPRASARAAQDLTSMGVEVRLTTLVTAVTREGVIIDGKLLPAENVIWAAGVRASELGAELGADLDHVGRVKVEADCSLPGHPNVFVIGDLANRQDPRTGALVPGVAQGAVQMGVFVARIIESEVRNSGKERDAFAYHDKGSMATIGKARAVVDIGRLFLAGLPAWLCWCFLHVFFLIGFKNKIVVMLSWVWTYVVHSRGARLITGTETYDNDR